MSPSSSKRARSARASSSNVRAAPSDETTAQVFTLDAFAVNGTLPMPGIAT